jgi:hypothetical protein
MKPKPRLTTAADLLTLAVGFVRCASPLTVLERLGYLPLPRAMMGVEMGVRLNVVIKVLGDSGSRIGGGAQTTSSATRTRAR